ncbi:29051_t:CDS:2 [Racocetra persica]|uniref:29051_t:CDS:1 n=1 Tax=Racocetra persica TaxID=160502 RepID=A0ACA9QRJ6_9GLOM|nr:29051_t:CDS:2 [Racocetra persica]
MAIQNKLINAKKQELEHIAKKFNTYSSSTYHKKQILRNNISNSTAPNLFSDSTRITQLQTTLNQVRGYFSNQSNHIIHTEFKINKGKTPVYFKHDTDPIPSTPSTSSTSNLTHEDSNENQNYSDYSTSE